MTRREEYEAMVERVAEKMARAPRTRNLVRHDIHAALTEVYRTLQTVTPEMLSAWRAREYQPLEPDKDWLAMLAASPLNPEEKL